MPFALRFLSGPRAGTTVPLDDDAPLVVGRRDGAGLSVDDETISRRHVRVALEGGELTVEDLGSANGTWLNGSRVQRARAVEGDRILLGSTLLRVVSREDASELAWASPEPLADWAPATPALPSSPAIARTSAGPEELPLVRMLRDLAASGGTALVAVTHQGHLAELKVEAGRMVACAIDGDGHLGARSSLRHLLSWGAGRCELRPLGQSALSGATGEPLALLLEEASIEAQRLQHSEDPPLAPGRTGR